MRKIVFATGNPNKVKEVNEVLPESLSIIGLKEIGCREDLPETSPTLEGNALQKARYVFEHFGTDCFSEDTGLEVDALEGAPGVYTARYAGPDCNPDDNIDLLLKNLIGAGDRKARFKTIIALILHGREYLFEGVAEGEIAMKRQGRGGFGYDPVFIPDGYEISFAKMASEEKNKISHRGKAVEKLVAFLENIDS